MSLQQQRAWNTSLALHTPKMCQGALKSSVQDFLRADIKDQGKNHLFPLFLNTQPGLKHPVARFEGLNCYFCSNVLQKTFEGAVSWKEWRWSFFFFFFLKWELKLKIPIYSHFPLEVCWAWLIPLLWYANGQLAFLQGTLAGGQGTQRRCPVRRAAQCSLGSSGAKLGLWLQNKIPLLIVSPSNINVCVFTLRVISAGQWQEHNFWAVPFGPEQCWTQSPLWRYSSSCPSFKS